MVQPSPEQTKANSPREVIQNFTELLNNTSIDGWSPTQIRKFARVLNKKGNELKQTAINRKKDLDTRKKNKALESALPDVEVASSSVSSFTGEANLHNGNHTNAQKEMEAQLTELRKELLSRFGGNGEEKSGRLEKYAQSLNVILTTLSEFPGSSAKKSVLWERVQSRGHTPEVVLKNILDAGEALGKLKISGEIVTAQSTPSRS